MIRQAKIEDARSIAEVHVGSWRSTYVGQVPDDFLAGMSIPKRETTWKASLKKGGNPVFVVVKDDVIAGFVCFGPSRDGDAGANGVGEIYSIYLRAEYQGRGLGKELWNAAVTSLKERGFKDVTLWVLDSNMRTRGFYEFMECQLDGETKMVNIGGKEVLEVRYRAALK